MRKIKIDNQTHYNMQHIRGFLIRAANAILDSDDVPLVFVTVSYRNRTLGSSGCALIGGNQMIVRLPKPAHLVDKIDFAQVCAHEFAHLQGLRHSDMRGASLYHRVGNWRELYQWAEALPLEINPPQKRQRKTGHDLASLKLNAVHARIKEWQTKLKRAQTMLKKYRSKERYYLRRCAQLSTPSETE